MNQDRNIRVNWGTLNIPTIVGLIAVFGVVWNLASVMSQMNNRLNNIEASRQERGEIFAARIAAIEAATIKVTNMEYRITVNEQSIKSTNDRIDRMADAIGTLRDDISGVRTAIEVLTEQLKQAQKGPN